MATTLESNGKTFEIPMSLIVADKTKNSRTTMDPSTIEDLAETIKREGQLTPVKVERRDDGKFDLVFGYRRHAAIKMLMEASKKGEFTTIRAEVVEKLEPVTRKLQNIAENMAREDLSTYDQAVAFLDLKEGHDMSGSKIANHIGKSVGYVNNLMRVLGMLDDSIIKRWREECQPKFGMDSDGKKIPTSRRVCTMDFLEGLASKTPKANQEYELRVALGLEEPEEDGEGDEDGDGNAREPQASKRASMANLTKALKSAEEKMASLKEGEGEDPAAIAEMKGVIKTIKYAMGKTQSIGGVYKNPSEA